MNTAASRPRAMVMIPNKTKTTVKISKCPRVVGGTLTPLPTGETSLAGELAHSPSDDVGETGDDHRGQVEEGQSTSRLVSGVPRRDEVDATGEETTCPWSASHRRKPSVISDRDSLSRVPRRTRQITSSHHRLTKADPIMTTPKPVTMNANQFLAPILRSTMFEGNSWPPKRQPYSQSMAIETHKDDVWDEEHE